MKKIGFWHWLWLKILNGLKNIPKLPKLLKDTDPMFEVILGIIGMAFGAPILSVYLDCLVGLIVWLTSLLLIAHAFYRMEMEDC